MDNLIGWIMMTAAVLPVVIVLLLAWSGARSRNTSSDFTPDKPRRAAAALQGPQADPQNKQGVLKQVARGDRSPAERAMNALLLRFGVRHG